MSNSSTNFNLQEALSVLNRERHGDHDDWCVVDGDFAGQVDSTGDPIFTAFEAIAIAEKYIRDAAVKAAFAEMPEPINDWRNSIDPVEDPEMYAKMLAREQAPK